MTFASSELNFDNTVNFLDIKYSATFFLALILLNCTKEGASNRDNSIEGHYVLSVIAKQDSSGKWNQASWMRNCTGMLDYSSNGHMSVHFIPALSDSTKPYWYLAEYRVDYDSNLAYHKRILHSNFKDNFKTVKRSFTLQNDTLFMFASEFGLRLTWLKK